MSSETKKSRGWLRTVLVITLTAAITGPVGALIATSMKRQETAPQQAVKYHCPMHPSIVSDHPGDCPICGMKLVKLDEPGARPATSERKILFYRSPMDPRQTSPGPAKDSMGMDYLPVYEEDAAGHSEVDGLANVELDPTRQQLIGLRTAVIERGPVGGNFRTVGKVSVDETRVRRINVKVPGYVERVFVDFVGKPVRKGQPLFALYSPEVLAAENEFLTASRAQSESLVSAARRKLELWDVPEAELQRLEKEGTVSRAITYVSPVNGVVTRKDLVEGTRLEVGAMPYDVVDLSTLWVLADVYETELRFVSPGVPAQLTLNAFPGRLFSGKVLFVDPLLDPKTRTARVRLSFANTAGELKPEMFGEVVVERPARDVLRVPSDALIRSGTEDVVFVARGEGRFEPRRVTLGEVGRDFTEVVDGLSVGDAVVTRANFLIDSESRLRASLSRLSTPTGPKGTSADASMPAGHEMTP